MGFGGGCFCCAGCLNWDFWDGVCFDRLSMTQIGNLSESRIFGIARIPQIDLSLGRCYAASWDLGVFSIHRSPLCGFGGGCFSG